MAILANCTCGQQYDLKEEYSGMLMQCPSCGGQLQAGASVPARGSDPVFSQDKYLLRQKHLSLSQKYFVWDEKGHTLMFVLRPTHLLRNFVALVAGVSASLIVFSATGMVAVRFAEANMQVLAGVMAFLSFAAAIFTLVSVGSGLAKKRHIQFFRDESQQELLLEVKQDQKLVLLNASFTLCDPAGQVLGRFEKNYIYNIFRKRWRFFTPEGAVQYVAQEDSFGLLRTNYIILDADERLVGQFNRKLTLLDRYVLDLTPDTAQSFDRRVAVALGVMLDTAERR
jgi:hypothetical protein